MSGSLLCFLAFASTLIATNRGMASGLAAFLAWGYSFGILKAHFIETNGLFIFDASTIGFYLGLLASPLVRNQKQRFRSIIPWFIVLVGWPLFMAMVPIQHYLVQVIGLRGNIFWLPMMLVGFLLRPVDKSALVVWLAVLNLVAFGFAIAEFFIGVETFIPENSVTTLVFDSNDLKDGALRIPSVFANAHSYALFMVATIPWLIGELVGSKSMRSVGVFGMPLLVAGLISALLGIFMAGPRQPVVILAILIGLILFSRGFNLGFLVIVGLAGVIVGFLVAQDERLQRFTKLQDLDAVQDRINMSLNMGFFEILMDYPMGNGMGGGGTSLPGFAQALLNRTIILENEYARILLEQGLPGLLLFIGFFYWYMTRQIQKTDPEYIQKNYIRFYSFISISTAFIGIGLMTTIPGTAFLLLGVGYSISPAFELRFAAQSKGLFAAGNSEMAYLPAYQKGLARA